MTRGAAVEQVSNQPENTATKLRCPFCGHQGVNIEEPWEGCLNSQSQNSLGNCISFKDSAVHEHRAHCPGCGEAYIYPVILECPVAGVFRTRPTSQPDLGHGDERRVAWPQT